MASTIPPSSFPVEGQQQEQSANAHHHHHHHHDHRERSPLLVTKNSSYGGEIEENNDNVYSSQPGDDPIALLTIPKGTSSTKNVGMNLAKTAAGTGILALPYACKEGGLLLFVVGTLVIAVWNVFSLKRLCDCLTILLETTTTTAAAAATDEAEDSQHARIRRQQQYRRPPPPPAGTATLGKVAYYACGDTGLVVLDIMLLLLLSGIVIAYECAILEFAKGTPFTTTNNVLDAIILAMLMVPLCLVDDLSNLSKLSRLGLVILGFTMFVIAGYGIHDKYYNDDESDNKNDDDDDDNNTNNPFHWLPPNGITGISHWFGCVVFGFGIVPLTFNFRESMSEPDTLPITALVAMSLVAAAYIVTGVSLLFLYPDINEDVLSELPSGKSLATVTKLAMIVVVMATAPLLIVPCAEIIEGKIHHDGHVHPKTVLVARTGLCLFTVAISVMLPGFVTVLAFVGCFSVSLVSFCVPPFLHMVLLYQQRRYYNTHQEDTSHHHDHPSQRRRTPSLLRLDVAIDLMTFILGVATTVVTTFIVFQKMIEKDVS
jgi:amino acid permease